MAVLLAVACQAPPTVLYQQQALLPGRTPFEQLQFVSQIDELAETTADYARCSAASTLSDCS